MALHGLPFEHSIAHAVGDGDTEDIPVPAIRASDKLLAVIMHDAATDVAVGLDIDDFTVADGQITAATIDTSDHLLLVIWTPDNS